jgi:hypothetical protein
MGPQPAELESVPTVQTKKTKVIDPNEAKIDKISKLLGLNKDKMSSIFDDIANKGNLSLENTKYLNEQIKTNQKLQSEIFKFSSSRGNPNDLDKTPESLDLSDEELKKKNRRLESDPQNKDLFDTKTKILIGLFVACVLLATGGLPLIGAIPVLSQGSLIAGAVLSGIGAVGSIVYNKISSDMENNRVYPLPNEDSQRASDGKKDTNNEDKSLNILKALIENKIQNMEAYKAKNTSPLPSEETKQSHIINALDLATPTKIKEDKSASPASPEQTWVQKMLNRDSLDPRARGQSNEI